jgi:hypothetical protein
MLYGACRLLQVVGCLRHVACCMRHVALMQRPEAEMATPLKAALDQAIHAEMNAPAWPPQSVATCRPAPPRAALRAESYVLFAE